MKFPCPHCAQSLSASEDLHGVEMDCPTCHESLKVPLPELEEIILSSPRDPQRIPLVSSLQGAAKHWMKSLRDLPKALKISAAVIFGLFLVIAVFSNNKTSTIAEDESTVSPQEVATRMREAYQSALSVMQDANYAPALAERQKRRPLTQKEYLTAIQRSLQESLPRLGRVELKGCPQEFVELFSSFRKAVSDGADSPTLLALVATHEFMSVAAARYGTDPDFEKGGRTSERKLRREMIERGEYPLP